MDMREFKREMQPATPKPQDPSEDLELEMFGNEWDWTPPWMWGLSPEQREAYRNMTGPTGLGI